MAARVTGGEVERRVGDRAAGVGGEVERGADLVPAHRVLAGGLDVVAGHAPGGELDGPGRAHPGPGVVVADGLRHAWNFTTWLPRWSSNFQLIVKDRASPATSWWS